VTWQRVIGWLGLALLVFLHFDFWRPHESVLMFGWLPRELGYRILWVLLAWAYLGFICRWLWRPANPDEEHRPAQQPDQGAEP
jgi:hypothetical protein